MRLETTYNGDLPANGNVPFVRPHFSLSASGSNSQGTLSTLPDLVEFNAFRNPTHLFCVQYSRNLNDVPRSICYSDLYNAVLRFSVWLAAEGLAQGPDFVDGEVGVAQPVAILMASDINWFIAFLALLRLGVPVCHSICPRLVLFKGLYWAGTMPFHAPSATSCRSPGPLDENTRDSRIPTASATGMREHRPARY